MADSITDLKTPWIPVDRELGGQRWRLRFTNEAMRLLVEHFGGAEQANEALGGLVAPGVKKASTILAYLWAGLQEDAYLKWKRGERSDDSISLSDVKAWLPDDRGELTELLNGIFGAYTAAQQKQDPNA